jgi:3-mercaptopyruvate sulfurtransferase SseA
MAQKMAGIGYTSVYALKGGWREWEKHGNPTEKK